MILKRSACGMRRVQLELLLLLVIAQPQTQGRKKQLFTFPR